MKSLSVRELKESIEKVEEKIFFIDMIDHWTTQDINNYSKATEELKELKSLLIQKTANNN